MEDTYFTGHSATHTLYDFTITGCSPSVESPIIDPSTGLPFPYTNNTSSFAFNETTSSFIFDLARRRADSSATLMAKDEDVEDELPKRKRALQRLSLGSSIASSAPSTAPSEADGLEADADQDWASNSQDDGRQTSLSRDDDWSDSVETPFGFDVSMPSIDRCPDLVPSKSSSTLANFDGQLSHHHRASDVQHQVSGPPTSSNSATPFSFSDFISDCENDGHGPSSSDAALQQTVDSASALSLNTPAHTPSHRSIMQRRMSDFAAAQSPFETSGSPSTFSPACSSSPLTAGPASVSESTPGAPCSSMPPANSPMVGSQRPQLSLHVQTPTRHYSIDGPSTSSAVQDPFSLYLDRSGPSHGFETTAGLGLFGVSRPEGPPRSYSMPSGVETLSCNPAYITPSSCESTTPAEPSPSQVLFSRNNSVSSSPSPYASPLVCVTSPWNVTTSNGDEGHPIETASTTVIGGASYRTSDDPFEQGARPGAPPMMMSYSAPAYGMSLPYRRPSSSSSGSAGQPMRRASGISSHTSSPYAPSTAMLSPQYTNILSRSVTSGSLAHLANPYTGIITKRSRGRRVPNDPEQMNNLGKSGKVYTCKVPGCGKCFKRSEHLKRHVRSIHTDEKREFNDWRQITTLGVTRC